MGTQLTARQRKARRKAFAKRERELGALADRQHGVVSRSQLLAAGLGVRTIRRRVEAGRIHCLHRGVYAFGSTRVGRHGEWMAAVLACGDGALLSHKSAAALWGLMRPDGGPVEVSSPAGRGRPGIAVHEGGVDNADRAVVDAIPVTSVARTLFDFAEVVDERRLERAFEEADRLHLLEMRALEAVCARGHGRRALRPVRRLIEAARDPATTRSPLEDRFVIFCREHDLPAPVTNVLILGNEVDAFWPSRRLIVELDGFGYHRHRAAFERDRARDAARQAAGYRVVRLTHRRLEEDAAAVVSELRRLLAADRGEGGQGAVEWIALILVVALLFAGIFAAGMRVPGATLAQAVASRILCAASMADSCGADEPSLIAAYGSEVGGLVRASIPSLAFERGSRAVPVDFRRCRSSACGDGPPRGPVLRSDAGLPVTAFVHVIDCRPDAPDSTDAGGADCSDSRAGNLYIQYWFYYPESATLRGVPVAGEAGYHRDDWESLQVRIGRDGSVAQRASSHHGYNHVQGMANAGSDAGLEPVRDLAEAFGVRPRNGWGPASPLLLVSGGSHAGNASGFPRIERLAPGHRIHLIPLEPIAGTGDRYRFAVTPPWRKRVWRDPEAEGTD